MKRKKSRILPVPGKRGLVDYSVPVARKAQERAERSRREMALGDEMIRDAARGRREPVGTGVGGSRIMPMIRDD